MGIAEENGKRVRELTEKLFAKKNDMPMSKVEVGKLSNEHINQFQTRTKELEEEVENNNITIKNLKETNMSVKKERAELHEKVESLNKKIAELETKPTIEAPPSLFMVTQQRETELLSKIDSLNSEI